MVNKWRSMLAVGLLSMFMVMTVLLIVKSVKTETPVTETLVVDQIDSMASNQESLEIKREETNTNKQIINTEQKQKEEQQKEQQGENKQVTTTQPSKKSDFKIVGYYPSWKPEKASTIQYDKLTHINYSFAIPTKEGGILPLENEELAKQMIQEGHKKGVKVLIAVGGWEYKGTPLENTFIEATSTKEKTKKLGDSILKVVDTYGFDGVDMDWEHPRTDGNSKKQYEALMLYLRQQLDTRSKLLTSAVVAGVTPDGNTLWDAAGHTDAVLEAVDWVNVMAYDGGDGERHSSLEFAKASGLYWRDTRGLGKEKVVLGVPFYGRPGWKTYEELLREDDKAATKDSIEQMYYNGQKTIQNKTEWAKEELAGIMIWELAGDTTEPSKSLLTAIYETAIK